MSGLESALNLALVMYKMVLFLVCFFVFLLIPAGLLIYYLKREERWLLLTLAGFIIGIAAALFLEIIPHFW